ncbi:PIN domain-containing protein [Mesobaculum littorinae]|uniref:PIN domain-containing protein n=1 Tax=Mesobaculum littorinae TaxID=2486419 RepID=A0A438AMJ5_9RHOB|nr:PIN domain-containing protein [Mesobaculum littorinae]RVV99766.1 PIN domain-containing protein [Mesobaculum littorinae]
MKVLIDANVLFPTVLREIVLGVASRGGFTPLWSARILEEWARAADRLGPGAEVQARGEVALLRAAWPGAEMRPRDGDMARLWLPDPADVHVLAAAIAGSVDAILTMNARDFPRHLLAEWDIERVDPDALLMRLWQEDADLVAPAVVATHAEACRLSGEDLDLRGLLKRARLPRLAKALS